MNIFVRLFILLPVITIGCISRSPQYILSPYESSEFLRPTIQAHLEAKKHFDSNQTLISISWIRGNGNDESAILFINVSLTGMASMGVDSPSKGGHWTQKEISTDQLEAIKAIIQDMPNQGKRPSICVSQMVVSCVHHSPMESA